MARNDKTPYSRSVMAVKADHTPPMMSQSARGVESIQAGRPAKKSVLTWQGKAAVQATLRMPTRVGTMTLA